MSDRPRVQVSVLGPAQITVAGAPAPAELLWRKHLALLVYLARSPRRARTREHLIGLLWSERDDKSARHSLSEALRVFRRVLGDAQVRADVDQVSLAGDALTLDCEELLTRSAAQEWGAAAALVQGDFLEGLSIPEANEFESWLAGERFAWRARGVEALTRHAESLLAAGDPGAARAAALRALTLDATAEAAARSGMRALALGGDRAGALALAERLTVDLHERLGTTPTPETQRLIERIREARVARRVVATPGGARARPPLVGRREPLARLICAWDGVRGGKGACVLIEAEPGEGKTRLVDELLDRARLEDATVAACRAVPADADVPWSGLAGLLTGGLDAAPGLAGTPPAALASLATLDPELGGHSSSGGIEPPRAFAALVRAVASEQPVLLALDDAHDLDAATMGSLPQLARDLAAWPVLLIISAFPVGGSRRLDWLESLRAHLGRELRGEAIRLERLDASALGELARWALPRYGAEEIARLVRRLERDTAGLPLLVAAMLEAIVDGFRLSAEGPAWPSERRTLVDTLPGDLPPAVIGAICLEFNRLPPVVQEVLAAAAALGGRVSAATLARATGFELPNVDQALDRLEWDRWLTAESRGYAFAAPIARSVLLQEMVRPGRAGRYRDAVRANPPAQDG
jgi:DNA-binding SARP family transcriptional activator